MIAESDSIPIVMGGDFYATRIWTDRGRPKICYNHGGAVVNWTVSKEMQAATLKIASVRLIPTR